MSLLSLESIQASKVGSAPNEFRHRWRPDSEISASVLSQGRYPPRSPPVWLRGRCERHTGARRWHLLPHPPSRPLRAAKTCMRLQPWPPPALRPRILGGQMACRARVIWAAARPHPGPPANEAPTHPPTQRLEPRRHPVTRYMTPRNHAPRAPRTRARPSLTAWSERRTSTLVEVKR